MSKKEKPLACPFCEESCSNPECPYNNELVEKISAHLMVSDYEGSISKKEIAKQILDMVKEESRQ